MVEDVRPVADCCVEDCRSGIEGSLGAVTNFHLSADGSYGYTSPVSRRSIDKLDSTHYGRLSRTAGEALLVLSNPIGESRNREKRESGE